MADQQDPAQTKKPLALAQPQDRSLQAFKDWMIGMVNKMGIKGAEDISDAVWEESWKRFWSNEETPAEQPEE
jgi:hypothetical protein